MVKLFKRLHKNQQGSYFIEIALTIIGLALVVGSYMKGLGSATGSKIGEITDKVSMVGQ